MYDVIIIGSRIAGAALALRLGQAQARVLLIEKAELPSDTLSSAFLWPPTLMYFDRLGILNEINRNLPELNTWIKFREGIEICGTPPWSGSYHYSLSPKRIYLDEILLKQALQTGNVDFWNRSQVEKLLYEGEHVSGVMASRNGKSWAARTTLVVGADGRDSFVVRSVRPHRKRFYTAYRAWFVAYLSGWQGDRTQVITGTQGADWMGITATHDGHMLASLSIPLAALPDFRHHPRVEFLKRLRCNSVVADRMGGVEIVERLRGTTRLAGWVHQAFGPGWAILGDAGAHTDPITATGIGFSLISADWLADALTQSKDNLVLQLSEYERRRDALYSPVFDATSSPPKSPAAENLARWMQVATDPLCVEEHFTAIAHDIESWFQA